MLFLAEIWRVLICITKWACRCHPYIESTDSLILYRPCTDSYKGYKPAQMVHACYIHISVHFKCALKPRMLTFHMDGMWKMDANNECIMEYGSTPYIGMALKK